MSACWPGEGCVGYWAAMVWSSVQVPRPRVSTSAGQSAAGPALAAAAVVAAIAAAAAVPAEPPPDEGVLSVDLVWFAHDANEVHDRHLCILWLAHSPCEVKEVYGMLCPRQTNTYGLPSLPSTTPFGILFGASTTAAGCSGCTSVGMDVCYRRQVLKGLLHKSTLFCWAHKSCSDGQLYVKAWDGVAAHDVPVYVRSKVLKDAFRAGFVISPRRNKAEGLALCHCKPHTTPPAKR